MITLQESNSLARILNTDLEDLFSKKFLLSGINTVFWILSANNHHFCSLGQGSTARSKIFIFLGNGSIRYFEILSVLA